MTTTRAFLFSVAAAACAWAQPTPEPESTRLPDGVPTLSTSHTLSIERVLLSPDGRRVFTYDGGNIFAWDFESRKKLRPLRNVASSRKGSELSEFKFITAEKRLIFAGGESVNYETLEPFEPLSGIPPKATVWDPKRKKRFWAGGSRAEIEFGELVYNKPAARASRAHAVVKAKDIQDYPASCYSLIALEDGRLLACTNYGVFYIDPDTWTISSPGREPERSIRSLMYMDETRDVKIATFTCERASGGYVEGPQETLIFVESSSIAEKRTTFSVVAAKDLTVLRTTVMEGFPSYLGTGTFDAAKKQLWFKTGQNLVALDFDTLAPRNSLSVKKLFEQDPYGGIGDAVPVPGTTHWLVSAGKTLWLYDAATESAVGRFGEAVPAFTRITTHPTRFEFLVSDQSGMAKRVRFLPGGIEVSHAKGQFTSFAFDPTDGETVAYGSSGLPIIYFSERSRWPKEEFRLPQPASADTHGAPAHLIYSQDGSRIVSHSSYGVTAYDLSSGKTVLNQPGSRKSIPFGRQITAVSPDNKWVVTYDGDQKLIGYDCERGQKAWEHSVPYVPALIYFAGAKTVCTLVNGQLEYRSAETGVLKLSTQLNGSAFADTAAVSPDRKLIACASYDLFVFDPETESVVFRAKTYGRLRAVAFFSNPRYLITVGADNLLRLWDLQEKQELCSIALFADNDEWVVSTTNLRFDGSEKAIDKMYVVKGTDVIPLESLFDQLYTPKLLASLLAGEKLEPPSIDLQKLRAPPSAKLALADGTRNLTVENDTDGTELARDAVRLRATAEARDSSVAEVRLFQNGKLLASAPGTGAQLTHLFDAKLTPGENVFRLVAYNAERTESRPAEISLTYRPKSPAPSGTMADRPASTGGLQLHLLIVGVNTYKNPKYNLNYAVADATAVKERLEAQTKSIFTAINVSFILNEKADKATLTSAFKTISARAGPRDVFVFYYAGHGAMTADAKPEFFLVPHDVTQLYGADDALRQKGLSSAELMELSKVIPAQKQLFILDACQSAGALKSVAMRGAAEEKAIAQLARSTGTHWLTASGSEQFATEFEQLGHGAFTYALIEGLAGKADTGDGRVTVNELKAWLETQVPELTQKHKGTPQYPSSYGFGQDFPVAVIAK
jgi:WD40 repeat protein